MKNILKKEDIGEILDLHKEAFKLLKSLKDKNKHGDKLKYPQISSYLTESIAINLLKEGLLLNELESYDFVFGGKESDILAIKDENKINIEVKATGKSAFQYFGDSDVKAKYIIWIHFNDFFENQNSDCLDVYVIKNPIKYFEPKKRYTLDNVTNLLGDNINKISFKISDIR